MGICAKLSHIRRKGRRASEMDTSIQLAPTTRQPKLNAAHQSPRPLRGQPVEASQLELADIAAARDPGLFWFFNYTRGWAFILLGKYDAAVEVLKTTEFA